MKYCLNYAKNSVYKDIVDELIIDYIPGETSFLNFLQEHKQQKVHMNVKYEDLTDFLTSGEIDVLEAIHKQHPDLNFEIKIPYFEQAAAALKEREIPFWFSEYVNDWDLLHSFLTLGACEVVVVENLGFEIEKVSNVVHAAAAQLRVIPNIAQTRARSSTPAMKKFFVRPEDGEFYEPYVDVFEFYYNAPNQGDVYYKIYAVDKKWYGNLREIILDLGEDIDSRGIMPTFASHRLRCGKRCFKGSGCQLCLKYQSLSKTLLDNNYIIKKRS